MNFVVTEMAPGEYGYRPIKYTSIRGPHMKEFFEPKLMTKKLSTNDLNRIALNEVIRGRKWSAPPMKAFMC
jgi:hypothetical protein